MQPDPLAARRRPAPSRTEPLVQSLEDRLLFRQAQGILVGLTDCGHADAARSLRTTAAELHLDVADLARRFLGCLADSRADAAQALLLRIVVLALLPDGAPGGPATGGREVTSVDALDVGGETRPAGALSVALTADGLTVHGVLDAATVPLLQERTRPMSVARAIRSSDGGVFQLDLAGLTHVDAAGLRALDALATGVRVGGATLRVTTPLSPGLGQLLHVAVSMRWLPAAFEVPSSASTPRHGGRPGTRPAGGTVTPGGAVSLQELDALYDRYASACWSLAHRLVGDAGEAEAVVQTAFLDAWQQLTSGTPPTEHAGAQLLGRTHREAVRRLREARTGPRPPTRAPDDDEPLGPLDRRHAPRPSSSISHAALARLPEHQAGPLRLAFWSGLTVQQIAATTGTPLADVRANLLAGVRTLSHPRDHRSSGGNVRTHEADGP